jgi:hypothetical protein
MQKYKQILGQLNETVDWEKRNETMKHYRDRVNRNRRRLDKYIAKGDAVTSALKQEIESAKKIKDPEQRKAKMEQIRKKYKIKGEQK